MHYQCFSCHVFMMPHGDCKSAKCLQLHHDPNLCVNSVLLYDSIMIHCGGESKVLCLCVRVCWC